MCCQINRAISVTTLWIQHSARLTFAFLILPFPVDDTFIQLGAGGQGGNDDLILEPLIAATAPPSYNEHTNHLRVEGESCHSARASSFGSYSHLDPRFSATPSSFQGE